MEGLLMVPEERNSETAKPFFANALSLLKQTFQEWLQDKAPQLGPRLPTTQFFRSHHWSSFC
jgi:hypothetical protein